MGLHTSGKKVKHQILLRMAKIVPCKCDNFVPIVVPCRSSEAHLASSAEDPAESTEELTPDEQEMTQASRNRLQDFPKWLQEFSSVSGIRDPPEPPRPNPVPAKAPEGKHQLFFAFSNESRW